MPTDAAQVLLIEDDVSHAEMAGEGLSRAGFIVTLAHSGLNTSSTSCYATCDCPTQMEWKF